MPTYNHLSDQELMEKLIKTIDKSENSQNLNRHKNVLSLMMKDQFDQNLKSSKIQDSIEIIREMYYRANNESLPNIARLNTKSKIDKYLNQYFHGLNHENAIAIAINNQCDVIDIYELSKGDQNSATIDTPEVTRWALKNRAAGIFIAHNHPNEESNPSDDDILLAQQLQSELKYFGIQLMDSLIITNKDIYSMASHQNIK